MHGREAEMHTDVSLQWHAWSVLCLALAALGPSSSCSDGIQGNIGRMAEMYPTSYNVNPQPGLWSHLTPHP